MNTIPQLTGLIAATYTPFYQDGRLNLDQIEPMVDLLIDDGVAGVYVCGSTGEGMSLTFEERFSVAEAFVAAVKGRVTVIVQVGRNCLIEAKQLAQHAQEIGADIVSAACPSYYKINRLETLIDCVAEIASGAANTPFYYYHIPVLTGIDHDMVDFLRLGRDSIPNLAGIKYTEPLLHEYQRCREFADGQFDIVWGTDEMLLEAIGVGARAAIGSTYNVAAALNLRIIDAFQSGEFDKAKELQLKAIQMVNVLSSYPYHSAMKVLLKILGRNYGSCRLPIANLSPAEAESLHKELQAIGFFDWHHVKVQSSGICESSVRGENINE